jgi:hypothetical protein
VAQKKRRKRRWLRNLLLFVCTPVLVWILAFVIWFFWRDIARLFDKKSAIKTPPGASRRPERIEPRRENRSQEKIPEEDRRKLDEILKNR